MTGPFVIDPNVVVAGLLTAEAEAPTARLLDALLAEYRQALLRPQIAAHHALSPAEIDEILVDLAANGHVVEARPVAHPVFPRGDGHLESLLAGAPGARLVTGDERARAAAGARAVTPAAAWQLASGAR